MDGGGGEGADVHTALLCECSEIIMPIGGIALLPK